MVRVERKVSKHDFRDEHLSKEVDGLRAEFIEFKKDVKEVSAMCHRILGKLGE